MAKEFNLEIDDSLNEVIDESVGNRYIALRKLRWTPESPFKVDIRNWYVNSNGEEIAGKGVSFMTPEGPDNLIEALLKNGYGDTRKTLNGIKDREDFLVSVKEIITENNMDLDSVELQTIDSIEDLYDPKAILK